MLARLHQYKLHIFHVVLLNVNNSMLSFEYFPWDFLAFRVLIWCLYNVKLFVIIVLQFMVMNYNGMQYTLDRPNNTDPAESAMPWVYCCLPMMLN